MIKQPPFVILALPRSRTAWLSQFLSYGGWQCGHEQLRYMRSLEDVKTWLSMENTGTVETGAAPFWRLIPKYRSDARIVTIRRPVEEVVESLIKVGMTADVADIRKVMIGLDRKLDQLEQRLHNVKSIPFASLTDEVTCGEIFEYCLPFGHDHDWWKRLSDINIQINFAALTRYAAAHLPALKKLEAQAKQEILRGFALARPEMTGVVIADETFDAWESDCQHLFRQHCADVGEHPDNWMKKNIPLMRRLYEAGAMQVIIARSNGRPFGYLMTVIAPSLEAIDRKSSQHTTFFAAKELPGLGLKLQRAAMASLKEKGVHEIFMRAGVRGDGDRMDVLYKRLGGSDFGRMYRVEL